MKFESWLTRLLLVKQGTEIAREDLEDLPEVYGYANGTLKKLLQYMFGPELNERESIHVLIKKIDLFKGRLTKLHSHLKALNNPETAVVKKISHILELRAELDDKAYDSLGELLDILLAEKDKSSNSIILNSFYTQITDIQSAMKKLGNLELKEISKLQEVLEEKMLTICDPDLAIWALPEKPNVFQVTPEKWEKLILFFESVDYVKNKQAGKPKADLYKIANPIFRRIKSFFGLDDINTTMPEFIQKLKIEKDLTKEAVGTAPKSPSRQQYDLAYARQTAAAKLFRDFAVAQAEIIKTGTWRANFGRGIKIMGLNLDKNNQAQPVPNLIANIYMHCTALEKCNLDEAYQAFLRFDNQAIAKFHETNFFFKRRNETKQYYAEFHKAFLVLKAQIEIISSEQGQSYGKPSFQLAQ